MTVYQAALNGKVALVAGGTAGIGLAMAEVLCRCGAEVAVAGRDADRAEAASQQIFREHGARVTPFAADITDPVQVARLVRQIRAEVGAPDILVDSVGGFEALPASPLDLPFAEWSHMMRLNLDSAFLIASEVLPSMLSSGWGRIVFVGSAAGRTGMPRSSPAYAAAKAGLIGLARSLARLTADRGVTVNVICPGSTATERSDRLKIGNPQAHAEICRDIPIGRLSRSAEIAGLLPYLVSDLGASATGAVFDVNGGRVMA